MGLSREVGSSGKSTVQVQADQGLKELDVTLFPPKFVNPFMFSTSINVTDTHKGSVSLLGTKPFCVPDFLDYRKQPSLSLHDLF